MGRFAKQRRLVSFENGKVTFRWKDYAHGNRNHTMTVDAVEFIRRFLLHSLPKGFQRIRHYGFLANRTRQQKLSLCRALLSSTREDTMPRDATASSKPSRHSRKPQQQMSRVLPAARDA